MALNKTVIISGSVDMSVRVWCRETGGQLSLITMQVRTISDRLGIDLHHQDIVTSVCLYEDKIISTGLDRTVHTHLITFPDIQQDFDAAITVRHLPDSTK